MSDDRFAALLCGAVFLWAVTFGALAIACGRGDPPRLDAAIVTVVVTATPTAIPTPTEIPPTPTERPVPLPTATPRVVYIAPPAVDPCESAFKRWSALYALAAAETDATIESAAKHNADNVALQEARNKSPNPDMLPLVTDAGYNLPPRAQLLDEALKKFGITREPPACIR